MLTFWLTSVLGLASGGKTATTVDLGGTWQLSGDAKPVKGMSIKATVPGQVYTDLLAAGVIGEPFNASNPDKQQWVANASWTYSRDFDVAEEFLSNEVVQLVSMGIDTVATIDINGQSVFDTDNMFHRIRLNAKPYLKSGSNTIVVKFKSKVLEAAANAASCNTDTSIICPSGYRPPVQHGFDNQNYLRTEPSSFSWDWGPGFAPVGLWRSIYLQGYSSAVVRDILVATTPKKAGAELAARKRSKLFEPADQYAESDRSEEAVIARAFRRTDRELDLSKWDLEATVFVDAGVSDDKNTALQGDTVQGKVTIALESGDTASADVSVPRGSEVSVKVSLSGVSNVSAWFPNGFGTQKLYILSATFEPAGEVAPQSPPSVPYPLDDGAIKGIDGQLSVRVGFRTIELVQDPLPGGKSYYFRVNGVPIPVKGSNWIPADAFESRISRNTPGTTRLEPIFAALRESNQNMIRNWGGGIYQRDSFYDLADENGIMIWQDMMFACATYAAPDWFLQSAAKEIRDNVKRMQPHPSIALWAGNNEDERDMKNKGSQDISPPYIEAYSKLTFLTALNNVSALDETRPLSGSSPSCGNETAAKPFSWDHQSQFYGDVHCYLYDANNWDVRIYKRPRFMSEFGLQSWPSGLTMSRVFPSDQWYYTSDLMLNRNHHGDGQDEMLEQIAYHFHLPTETRAPAAIEYVYRDWSYMLWMTQLNQALGYKIEVEYFRAIRTDCSETVPGCNMGRMYWQTNDIWQGASWAAIDYTGRYKMVQYYTTKFYEPFHVAAFGTPQHQDFQISVINDDPYKGAVKGVVRVTMNTWQDGRIGSWDVPFKSQPASAEYVYNSTFLDMLEKGGCPQNDATLCFLTLEAIEDGTGDILSSNFLLLTPMYDVVTMKNPQLALSKVKPADERTALGARLGEQPFDVTISAQAVAAFVWIETPFAGRWSDNGILMTQPNVTLTFFADTAVNGNITSDQLKSSIKPPFQKWAGGGGLWSLVDTNKQYMSGSPWP